MSRIESVHLPSQIFFTVVRHSTTQQKRTFSWRLLVTGLSLRVLDADATSLDLLAVRGKYGL